jgi:hypothetical protein
MMAELTRQDLDRIWQKLDAISADIKTMAVNMEGKVDRGIVEHMLNIHIQGCPHGNRLGKIIALCAGTALSSSGATLAIAKIIGM